MEAVFERGRLLSQNESSTREPDGTLVEFEPDPEIFGEYAFNMEFVEKRFRNYAYLNHGAHPVPQRHGLLFPERPSGSPKTKWGEHPSTRSVVAGATR
jgi:hypothetical protein